MNKTIDLHVHSTASDGTFTPTELVAEAKRCGLSAFALTDHDTVDGISEALAASEASGLEVIPGVELSTEYQRNGNPCRRTLYRSCQYRTSGRTGKIP
ncbi:MAG: PHP domain-containing protein [Eubacterium ramulus]